MGKLVQCVDFIVFLRELLSRNIPAVAGLLLFEKRHRVRVRSNDDAVCNEKPDTLYSATGIIRMPWAGCVVRMKQMRNKYRVGI